MSALREIPGAGQVGAFWDAQARAASESSELSQFGTVTKSAAAVALRDQLEREHLGRVLKLSEHSRVLDLGGGAGRIALWLAPRVREVVLVNVSAELLAVAARTAHERNITNLRTVHSSALEFALEGTYDAVIVMGVCCHLGDPDLSRMADLCARALVPGGCLYLKEPVTTDGSERVDEQEEGGVPYRVLFRARERYAAVFGERLRCVYQQPTCAHLLPWFLGGTQQAADAVASPHASQLLRASAPLWVLLDPLMQRVEARLRGDPLLSLLLAPVPVLQDLYVFERGPDPAAPGAPPVLSVVVIAYNEQECLTPVVRELRATLAAARIAYELVLVDDGSSDGTLAQMQALHAEDARTRVVPLSPNRGIGGALRAGFDAAEGQYVTWVPADGQIGPDVVLALHQRRAQAEMITTVYRSRDDAWYRHVISGTLNRIISASTGQRARSGGNYLFAREQWQRHAPRADDSMMISTAFRANLRAAGERIEELEIDARARVAGRSKVLNPRTILRTLRGLRSVKRADRR